MPTRAMPRRRQPRPRLSSETDDISRWLDWCNKTIHPMCISASANRWRSHSCSLSAPKTRFAPRSRAPFASFRESARPRGQRFNTAPGSAARFVRFSTFAFLYARLKNKLNFNKSRPKLRSPTKFRSSDSRQATATPSSPPT